MKFVTVHLGSVGGVLIQRNKILPFNGNST